MEDIFDVGRFGEDGYDDFLSIGLVSRGGPRGLAKADNGEVWRERWVSEDWLCRNIWNQGKGEQNASPQLRSSIEHAHHGNWSVFAGN